MFAASANKDQRHEKSHPRATNQNHSSNISQVVVVESGQFINMFYTIFAAAESVYILPCIVLPMAIFLVKWDERTETGPLHGTITRCYINYTNWSSMYHLRSFSYFITRKENAEERM